MDDDDISAPASPYPASGKGIQPLRDEQALASNASVASGRPGAGGGMEGLDLSFGYTPMQFEKINLLGSGLSGHAISSLVLSVQNVTYLDLRGNNLQAAFGWQLVKAMKRRYLQLEFCNGVFTRGLRENKTEELVLSSFSGHHGLYGIEVVGAIFLAHFLRLNSSLTHINFARNDVQKDGAKALAQSLLGNPHCALRTVNNMGPARCPSKDRGGKPGIDFAQFRNSTLVTVNLSKRLLDDDDFVFLEEWLRRHDCVKNLDISHNLIGQPKWDGSSQTRDGIRKLTRHLKDTKTLTHLNCVGLPVDLEGTALLARAVVESETLETVALPLGPCDEKPERQQVLQSLGVGLSRHPTIKFFANAKLEEVRDGRLKELLLDRMIQSWGRGEVAVYMWCVASVRPAIPLEKLKFGSTGRPTKEYPEVTGAPPELFSPLIGIVHDIRSLIQIQIAIPSGYGKLMMELMRTLTRCSVLKTLHLYGYAGSKMKDNGQMPPEWAQLGAAPRWLLEDRIKKVKVHWQALNGLLSALPNLEQFNDISVEGNLREQPERLVQLLCQCLEGVAAEFAENGMGGEPRLVANLNAKADVDAFCDVLRILNRTPVLVELRFSDKNVERVKAQMLRLAAPLSQVPAGESGPKFTHAVELKNDFVSEALLKSLDHHAALREFCFERIEAVLPALFSALCGREKPLPVERIRIAPKWEITPRHAKKRFSEQQRRWLDSIHAALIRSDRFVEIQSMTAGSQSRDDIERLSPQQFAELMTGLAVDDPPQQEISPPKTSWRTFSSSRNMQMQLQEDASEEVEPQYVSLPVDMDMRNQIVKLSLCMCNLRKYISKVARPDEWADPSKVLWYSPQRFRRPGDWDEFDPWPQDDVEEEEEDQDRHVRYHWDRALRIGSKFSAAMHAVASDPQAVSFQDDLLHDSLKSLLEESPRLTWLDLRGNGLNREDANVVLSLLESLDPSFRYLNQIPVTMNEANECVKLDLDGTGIPRYQGALGGGQKNDNVFDDDDDPEEPEGEYFARQALESDYVRLDEGDGFLIVSLINSTNFKTLQSVSIRRHEIPDVTLPHICDALLSVPSINRLLLTDIRLSSRSALLLLSAVAEMAPRLVSLNGLPISRLLQLRDSSDGGPVELSGAVEWNDISLGAMARLNLWPVAAWPVHDQDGSGNDFQLQGRSITDVGLRGLCQMLRYFAGQERPERSGGMGRGHLVLTRIDLSGNPAITDAPVADLCHTLQHPVVGGNIRHSLRELDLRSCMRLKSRSAHELLQLIQRLREAALAQGSQALGSSLQMLSGVDLQALQAFSRTGSHTRQSVPPMLLRSFVESGEGHDAKAQLGKLSECDVHYFASILHLFPAIPHCHLHIVIPGDVHSGPSQLVGETDVWGSPDDEVPAHQGGILMPAVPVSNHSPFPAPYSTTAKTAASIQAHLDLAKRLFEACPISTQLRLSMAPCIPGVEDIHMQGDPAVLWVHNEQHALHQAQKVLRDRAAKTRSAKKKGLDEKTQTPKRPLYVNNINSQRLHDSFRTLYGQDDVELEHDDIFPTDKGSTVRLPTQVDVTQAFEVATSVDMQHLDLGPAQLANLSKVPEMHVLTHINLNYNMLGDSGVEHLFSALSNAGSSVVHISVGANNIGDIGAEFIASQLGNLARLTSLELRDNFIQEKGSHALAESIGGMVSADDIAADEAPPSDPLPMLSVDLSGNKSRYVGAMRWAEVICSHPKLQFLSLASNELGVTNADSFLGLVYAAVASAALSVLDLRENFPIGPGSSVMGPPPDHVREELLADLPSGEFDSQEVKQAVFIRRHRGGGGGTEKKGRQPQQGQGRHGHQG